MARRHGAAPAGHKFAWLEALVKRENLMGRADYPGKAASLTEAEELREVVDPAFKAFLRLTESFDRPDLPQITGATDP